jgi:hypothetical protein
MALPTPKLKPCATVEANPPSMLPPPGLGAIDKLQIVTKSESGTSFLDARALTGLGSRGGVLLLSLRRRRGRGAGRRGRAVRSNAEADPHEATCAAHRD